MLLALLAGCFLGAGTVWVLLGGGSGGQAVDGAAREVARGSQEAWPVFEPIEPPPPDAEEEQPPQVPRASAGTPSRPRAPVRQTLAEYWGPHWTAIEAHLLQEPNPKLDQEWPIPRPFEELVPDLERLLAEAVERQRGVLPMRIHAPVGFPLPNPLTEEGLQKSASWLRLRSSAVREIDETTLARAQEAAGALLEEMDRERTALVDAFHSACLRLLRTQRYGRSPYFNNMVILEALEMTPARGHYPPVFVHGVGGWNIVFAPRRDEHPELERLARERLVPLNEELGRVLRAILHQ